MNLIIRITTAVCIALSALAATPTADAGTYSLDSCRAMALRNNKELMIKTEKVRQAGLLRKAAFAAYLPALDFAGGYAYNQKNMSVFGSDQLLPTKSFNPATQTYEFNIVTNPVTHQPITTPDGQPIPSQVALIPKDALEFDIHNVFFGAVTLTQPIYMGGKIVAMNKLAGINEQANNLMHENEAQNVVYAVDAAYWTVVSLKAKHQLAKSYVNLLDTLSRNVKLMLEQGVATRSDLLSVDVKLNEANVDLLKVENGLSLSRMALAQICGMSASAPIDVTDSISGNFYPSSEIATRYDMEQVYSRRPDLRALEMASEASAMQKRLAMSEMLPNIALIGSYSFSNPNMFNGFSKSFDGAFSVGVMVKIPLWHWGGNLNRYRAAQSAETIAKIRIADAREKINLQVSQAAYKAQEAVKTFFATESNLAKAGENLRTANIGFREGVITTDNVMAAQTAWLKAHSEHIDASIDVHLCDVYLSKVLGTLGL